MMVGAQSTFLHRILVRSEIDKLHVLCRYLQSRAMVNNKKEELAFDSVQNAYPDGIIQSGTVYVIDSSKKCMYALSSPISQVSYLRKYSYNGKWQPLS